MGNESSSLAEEKTKIAVAGGKTSGQKKTVSGKKPVSGRGVPAKKRPEKEEKAPGKKKRAVGEKASARKRTVSGEKISARKRPVSDEKTSARKRAGQEESLASRKKSAAGDRAYGRGTMSAEDPIERPDSPVEEQDDFEARMSRRDAERARRRAEREKKVRRQKIIMAVSLCVILVSVIGIVVFCLSPVKTAFRLFQAERYLAKEDYEKARSAYEKVLTADETSVKAYRGLADLFDQQQMLSEQEQILYTGWEKTQDEDLLRYYCVTVLNQAVGEINARNCTLATVDKCVRALEQGAEDAKALELLSACYERLFKVTEEEDTCTMFFDADTAQDTCSYTDYEQLLRRMLAVYQTRPSEELKDVLKQYAVIDMPYVRISLPHVEAYSSLLTEINGAVSDAVITETLACLARVKEIRDYFSTAFDEFDAGNYAYARDLVSEEAYQKIRDGFIEENSGYWEGSVYIPVSREQMVLHREDGTVRFSFLGREDYENRKGIINVWGTHQEDDGVQRSVISYEPPEDAGSDSHTEYTIQYLYSNVKINGEYVPQMNYRFDTRETTPEGTTTNAIGDWGGEHEWEIDY